MFAQAVENSGVSHVVVQFEVLAFMPATVTYADEPGPKTVLGIVNPESAHDVNLATLKALKAVFAGVPVQEAFENC